MWRQGALGGQEGGRRWCPAAGGQRQAAVQQWRHCSGAATHGRLRRHTLLLMAGSWDRQEGGKRCGSLHSSSHSRLQPLAHVGPRDLPVFGPGHQTVDDKRPCAARARVGGGRAQGGAGLGARSIRHAKGSLLATPAEPSMHAPILPPRAASLSRWGCYLHVENAQTSLPSPPPLLPPALRAPPCLSPRSLPSAVPPPAPPSRRPLLACPPLAWPPPSTLPCGAPGCSAGFRGLLGRAAAAPLPHCRGARVDRVSAPGSGPQLP